MASNGQCPGLEMDKGIKQFGGNEELYLSILGYYVEDMQPLLEQVKAVSADGLEAYAQTAHAIKGASRNVFAESLGDAAEKLEHAAKDGDFEYVEANNAALYEEAQKLIKDIGDLLASKGM